jgi:hypothetical protein
MDLEMTALIFTLHVGILKQAYVTQVFMFSWPYFDLWIQILVIYRVEC